MGIKNKRGFILFVAGIILVLLSICLSRQITWSRFSHWGYNEEEFLLILNHIKYAGIFVGLGLILLACISRYERVWKRLTSMLLKLVLTAGSVMFTLLVIELVLYHKYKDIMIGGYDSPSHYTYAKRCNYNLRGFRETGYSYSKPPGTFRILAVGDSFTFGSGINDINDIYSEVLERKLNSMNQSVRYEVINFSRGGWSTQNELVNLRKEGLKYQPDLVVLGYVLNDPETREMKEEIRRKTMTSHILPYPYGRLLSAHSFTYYIFEKQINGLLPPKLSYEKMGDDYIASCYTKEHLDKYIPILEELINLVQENSRMVMLIFPLIRPFDSYPFSYAHDIIREVAVRKGVVVIDLLPVLSKMNHKMLTVSPWDGHPNETVHRLAAEMVYQKLVQEKMISLD
jgi:hypothetical protein